MQKLILLLIFKISIFSSEIGMQQIFDILECGDIKKITELLKTSNINFQRRYSQDSPLARICVLDNHVEILKIALTLKLDVDVQSREGLSPLDTELMACIKPPSQHDRFYYRSNSQTIYFSKIGDIELNDISADDRLDESSVKTLAILSACKKFALGEIPLCDGQDTIILPTVTELYDNYTFQDIAVMLLLASGTDLKLNFIEPDLNHHMLHSIENDFTIDFAREELYKLQKLINRDQIIKNETNDLTKVIHNYKIDSLEFNMIINYLINFIKKNPVNSNHRRILITVARRIAKEAIKSGLVHKNNMLPIELTLPEFLKANLPLTDFEFEINMQSGKRLNLVNLIEHELNDLLNSRKRKISAETPRNCKRIAGEKSL